MCVGKTVLASKNTGSAPEAICTRALGVVICRAAWREADLPSPTAREKAAQKLEPGGDTLIMTPRACASAGREGGKTVTGEFHGRPGQENKGRSRGIEFTCAGPTRRARQGGQASGKKDQKGPRGARETARETQRQRYCCSRKVGKAIQHIWSGNPPNCNTRSGSAGTWFKSEKGGGVPSKHPQMPRMHPKTPETDLSRSIRKIAIDPPGVATQYSSHSRVSLMRPLTS